MKKSLLLALGLGSVLLWGSAGFVFAQGIIPVPAAEDAVGEESEEDEKDPEFRSAFLPPDREQLKELSDARKLVEMEKYADAVLKLKSALDPKVDTLVPADGEQKYLYRSIRNQAEEILRTAPPRMLELYEVECGVTASQMLQSAVEQGDFAQIAACAQQYFYTKAGGRAAFMVGMTYLERNLSVSAVTMFRKLYDTPQHRAQFSPLLPMMLAMAYFASGEEERGMEVLKESDVPNTPGWRDLRLGGEPAAQVLADAKMDLPAWLKARVAELSQNDSEGRNLAGSWLTFQGNLQRNGSVENVDAPLLSPCWRVPILDDPEAMALVKILQNQGSSPMASSYAFPAARPLVVGETVLMRTCWNLTAVDLNTGKRLWDVPSLTYASVKKRLENPNDYKTLLGVLRFRLWGDGAFGDLSSDGSLVFAVEDTLDSVLPEKSSNVVLPRPNGVKVRKGGNPNLGNENEDGPDYTYPNRLCAYDIRTGKLLWHVGGAPAQWNLNLPGTMFLGAPLVVGQEVYAIAQFDGQIWLHTLDAKSGAVRWSAALSAARDDDVRIRPAYAPSYVDGILLCPTPNEAVVAVDIASHAVLWGISYSTETVEPVQNRWRHGFDISSDFAQPCLPNIVIDGDYAYFLTPASNGYSSKFCSVNWKTGELSTHACGMDILSGTYEGRLLGLIGSEGFCAYPLEDESDGTAVSPPAGTHVSGSGFRSGQYYYVPLSNGTVMKCDLSKEDNRETVASREGEVPGNLVPAGKYILSQCGDYLTAYVQTREARALVDELYARDAASPEAVTLEATLLWNDGKVLEAVEVLRRGGIFTENLLASAMLDGLKIDFPRFESQKDAIREKLTSPREKALLEQLVISALLNADRNAELLAECEVLMQYLDSLKPEEIALCELIEREDGWNFSMDDWMAQIFEQFSKKSPEAKTAFEVLVTRRWEVLRAEIETDAANRLKLPAYMVRFAASDRVPEMEQAWIAACERAQDHSALEKFYLLRAQSGTDPYTPIGDLVRHFAQEKPEFATEYYLYLLEKAPEAACVDGKTPAAWLETLPQDHPLRGKVAPRPDWKPGKITVREIPKSENDSYIYNSNFTRIRNGNQSIPLAGKTLIPSYGMSQSLICQNDWGETCWKIPLDAEDSDSFPDELSNKFLGTSTLFRRSGDAMELRSFGLTSLKFDWTWTWENKPLDLPPMYRPILEKIQRASGQENGRNGNVFVIRSRAYYGNFNGMAASPRISVLWNFSNDTLYAVDSLSGKLRWSQKNLGDVSSLSFDGERLYAANADEEVEEDDDTFLLESYEWMNSVKRPEKEGDWILVRDIPLQDFQNSLKYLKEGIPDSVSDETRKLCEFLKKMLEDLGDEIPDELPVVPVYTLDAKSGKILGTKNMPELDMYPRHGDRAFFNSNGVAGVWNFKTETFEWFMMTNPESDSVPFQYGVCRPEHHRAWLLTWDWELMTINLDDGTFTKSEPLLENPPTGELSSEYPRLVVLPTEDGGCLAALGTYCPPVEKEDEKKEEGAEEEEEDEDADPFGDDTGVSELYGIESVEIRQAVIWRLDKDSKKVWDKPVLVDHSCLVTQIPYRIPLMVLAHFKSHPAAGNNAGSDNTCLQLFDSRNGRLVFDAQWENVQQPFALEGFPQESRVRIQMGQQNLDMNFTDEPYAEGEEAVQVRPNLAAEIARRESNLESVRKFRKYLQTQRDNARKQFDANKPTDEMEVKIFADKEAEMDLNIQKYDAFIETESKAIEELKKSM